MVIDHTSLMWPCNFREPEGMVAQWISLLQPFDFAIVHRPGKHHSRADGLSRCTSRPCKRDTCPECKPLQKAVMAKTEAARCFTPAFPYQRHFDGYIEMSEEDAALFWEVDFLEAEHRPSPKFVRGYAGGGTLAWNNGTACASDISQCPSHGM